MDSDDATTALEAFKLCQSHRVSGAHIRSAAAREVNAAGAGAGISGSAAVQPPSAPPAAEEEEEQEIQVVFWKWGQGRQMLRCPLCRGEVACDSPVDWADHAKECALRVTERHQEQQQAQAEEAAAAEPAAAAEAEPAAQSLEADEEKEGAEEQAEPVRAEEKHKQEDDESSDKVPLCPSKHALCRFVVKKNIGTGYR